MLNAENKAAGTVETVRKALQRFPDEPELLSELAKALDSFRHGLTELRPREWALTHISPLVSTGSLESAISTTLKDLGVTWHGGLAIKVNAPEAQYFDADDRRSLPTAQEILREYARAS